MQGLAAAAPWSDPTKAVLTPFVKGVSLLLPTALGFRWVPDALAAPGTTFDLPCAPTRRVTPPGPFVEDAAALTTSWPAPAWGAGTVTVVDDVSLRHYRVEGGKVVTRSISTAFLPSEGDHRLLLVDFDGDGTPDVLHEQTANESGVYTFLGTRLAGGVGPGDAGAPMFDRGTGGVVKLTGFQLAADEVDLDGDGLPDFVVTTIDIDKGNVLRAVLQGRVVAKTRAFLNHKASADGIWFHGVPDAEVESDVGVRIRFTFSGAIDVQRSFTIVASADVDGDGRKDLVIRAGGQALSIRRGVAKGVWATEAREVRIPPLEKSPDVEAYAGDLTGDGKDDLVLLYRAPPGGADRTVVVISP